MVDVKESRKLNLLYRKNNYPTNVLSFPFKSIPFIKVPLIGDLVICMQIIEKEAKEQQKTIESHLAHMVIHGSLHLLGYDHITNENANNMESIESIIMTNLGYNDPYLIKLNDF